MYFKNENIIIREFTSQELSLFLDLFTNENVTRYLPYKSPEEFKQMFEKALSDYKEGPLSRWGIFNARNNDFVGMGLARIFLHNPEQIEIGYTLSENYWGKGVELKYVKPL